MTFEQQMWNKWADDDEERGWLIPEYRKEYEDGKETATTMEQKVENASEC